MAETDDKLREMAEHRGLKLVKSRRRKPGTGDFGRYGLTDSAGKSLLGVGNAGLTATAADIEDYLRAGTTSDWKVSADTAPARVDKPRRVEPEPEAEAPVDRRKASAVPAERGRAERRRLEPQGSRPEQQVSRPEQQVSRPEQQVSRPEQQVSRPEPKREKPVPVPKPAPELVIRDAKPADAAGLTRLLMQMAGIDVDAAGIARNLEAVRHGDGGVIVAELADLVGCCGWAVVPTVQHGRIGRLTVLVVDDRHRRRGVASKLLDAATEVLRRKGCTRIEVMSDIEVRNSHNFFRARKFEQTSYRFVRPIAEQTGAAGGSTAKGSGHHG